MRAEALAVLGRQRARWHRGALETFFRHKDMLFNPRYGRIGALGFGHILLVDVIGPVVEIQPIGRGATIAFHGSCGRPWPFSGR